MRRAGLDTHHYRGRNFWQGPAAICNSISDVMSQTSVPCQYDNMGKMFVVYPKSRDEGADIVSPKRNNSKKSVDPDTKNIFNKSVRNK